MKRKSHRTWRTRGEGETPVVLLANSHQFARGEVVDQLCVQSRGLLWCRQGRGEIVVDGERHAVEPGQFFLVPWDRRMIYRADGRDPFLLAKVHWAPRHRAGPVVLLVAHSRDSEVYGDASRGDRPVGSWRGGVRVGAMRDHPALFHLAEHVTARFSRGDRDESSMRALASMIEAEVIHVIDAPSPPAMSAGLRGVTLFVRDHLPRPLSLDTLADFAGCSRATLVRRFRRELGVAPAAWVARCRVDAASELLRTTHLPIGEIALRVGLLNPHYFSRVFRRHMRCTPRDYRRRVGGL